MGKYKPKRKLSAGEKKLFNLQKKSTITRGTSKNSLDPDKLRDVGYTKKPESTIEKPPTLTGRVDQTKGSPAPKRTTFKPENQFNSYNPLDEEMMNQEPAKARKRYKKNKPKRIISDAEKKAIEDASSAVKESLKGEDIEDIKKKTEALVQASMKLGEAIYKSQQNTKPDSNKDDGKDDKGKKDDNVVDADFEEVKDENKEKSA